MKKIFVLSLALLMLLLAACGGKTVTKPDKEPAADSVEEPVAEPTAEPTEEPVADSAEENKPDLTAGDSVLDFTAESFEGETVSLSDYSDAKLILVNFFEPWCPPCVAEMPALETVYQEYKDKGLVILGMFYTEGMDDNVASVIEQTGVTYPILRGCGDLMGQTSQYVPTTFFMDGQGRVVGEQIIGSLSLAEWEKVVKELLGE